MRRFGRWLVLILVGVVVGSAQTGKKTTTARRAPGASKPECAQGAICFSGEVREGQEFQKDLNADLEFVLHLPGGFDVISKHDGGSCKLSAWVANPPLRAHHDTEIDSAYDWTAEQEVQTSPREFRFATNCGDFQSLYDLSQTDAEKYFANLNSLAKGQGRLWITDSKTTHSHDSVVAGNGTVEWLKFSVEIKLPNPN
jgi:hypothetical protein